ncbi:MAG: hypothetical protein A2Y33_07250 [Spirochaetes bacterium GWF1_51_8]|nr:MAG: hypothetical protein A2Y33_07250 [Spirochaetes bacterium GWF1_51_8]
MALIIGNNNTFSGIVNIGDGAILKAKEFSLEFNTQEKLLDLLGLELEKNYSQEDKEQIIQQYKVFKEELLKPEEKRNSSALYKSFEFVKKGFAFIAGVSSIAGFILTVLSLVK